jgi:hypothetical protein
VKRQSAPRPGPHPGQDVCPEHVLGTSPGPNKCLLSSERRGRRAGRGDRPHRARARPRPALPRSCEQVPGTFRQRAMECPSGWLPDPYGRLRREVSPQGTPASRWMKSAAPRKESSALEKESPSREKESPSPRKESPSREKESPSLRKESPCHGKESPFPGNQSGSPRKESPFLRKESPSREKESGFPEKQSPSPWEETPFTGEWTPSARKESISLGTEGFALERFSAAIDPATRREARVAGHRPGPNKCLAPSRQHLLDTPLAPGEARCREQRA